MALTYTQTAAWNTTGTINGSNLEYKDVTVTCATGDLLVAVGLAANQNNVTGNNGSVVTSTGSTSAWTQASSPDPWENSDCAVTMAYATVSSGTSVTVRVTVGATDTQQMGAAVWVIPAAEWTGTPAFVAMDPDNATAVQSVTLSATSTVLLAMADWSAIDPTSISVTPTGTSHAKSYSASQYSWVLASWTAQSSGTRNYGLASDPGAVDYVGSLIVVQEVGGDVAHDRTVNDAAGVTDGEINPVRTGNTLITYGRTITIG